MGNDLDVCSKDGSIDEYFWNKHGRKDESTFQFLSRIYEKFCDSLVSPQRMSYSSGYLTRSVGSIDPLLFYEVREFKVFSQGVTLHCCVWIRKKDYFLNKQEDQQTECSPHHQPGAAESKTDGSSSECEEFPINDKSTSSSFTPPKPLCILYLHNNTRSIADALEVLPIAHELQASIFAFDLPGCGRSEGSLTGTMHKDVAQMVDWIKCIIDEDVEIILWARGMSTALAIQYSSSLARERTICPPQSPSQPRGGFFRGLLFGQRGAAADVDLNPAEVHTANGISVANQTSVIAVVLDTPFVGIEQVVQDLVSRSQRSNLRLPRSLVRAGSKIVLKSVAKRLNGLNLFDIRPIDACIHCTLPCFILAARNDDYIPLKHCREIARHWGSSNVKDFGRSSSRRSSRDSVNSMLNGKSDRASIPNDRKLIKFCEFDGKQFDERPSTVVKLPLRFLQQCSDPECFARNTDESESDLYCLPQINVPSRKRTDTGDSSIGDLSTDSGTETSAELLDSSEADEIRAVAAVLDEEDPYGNIQWELEHLGLQPRASLGSVPSEIVSTPLLFESLSTGNGKAPLPSTKQTQKELKEKAFVEENADTRASDGSLMSLPDDLKEELDPIGVHFSTPSSAAVPSDSLTSGIAQKENSINLNVINRSGSKSKLSSLRGMH